MSGTRGALLLSCTQASVAEFRRKTLAPDDEQEGSARLLLLDERSGHRLLA
jgi:hypothetical protein